VEGRHSQFLSLLALIDGRVVAQIPPKNHFREPKKSPYVVLIFELGTPSSSSCEYSSTRRICSIEEDVVYPWEIDVAVDHMLGFQERRMPKTKMTARLRSPSLLGFTLFFRTLDLVV